MTQPLVSVIIPAYRAHDILPAALASVLSCGLPLDQVEAVIASDDGTDYAPLVPPAMRARFSPPGPVASGVGAARNRALDIAQGRFVAFLDSDDLWAQGYLSDLMPLAQGAGLAFGPTEIIKDGRMVIRLPETARLDFAACAAAGASFRPLVRRDMVGRFKTTASQDILHTLELLSLTGGRAPLGQAAYRLAIRRGSVTSDAAFSQKLMRVYRDLIAMIRSGETRIKPEDMQAAIAVFEAKQALNAEYARQNEAPSYYEYIALRQLAHL